MRQLPPVGAATAGLAVALSVVAAWPLGSPQNLPPTRSLTHVGGSAQQPGTTLEARAFGPRGNVGPQETIRCKPGSVHLDPSRDLNAIIKSSASGSSFCFAPGLYVRAAIAPRQGDSYVAERGAIFDGQHAVPHAFASGAQDVLIENFVIRNYASAIQDGAISNCQLPGGRWIIRHNDVADNNAAGVYVCGNGSRVIANNLRHNGEEGYSCTGGNGFGGRNIVIADNDIAMNNPDDVVDPGFEAGGGKCSFTTGLVVAHNYSHGNHGPGLWIDIDNEGYRIEGNLVSGNWGGGIADEISWSGVILNNRLEGDANARYCRGWLWCGEIQIAASGGVGRAPIDVSGNVVISTAPGNAIVLIQQDRGSGRYGLRLVQNVQIHDNLIDVSRGGAIGAARDDGEDAVYESRGNQFYCNCFRGLSTDAFWWHNARGDLDWFRKQGQEAETSSFRQSSEKPCRGRHGSA